MNISALILAKNEEEMIADCIKQLDFAAEIILLDQKSCDRTVQIAKKLGARIISSNSDRFDLNRNELKNNAKGEWLLYVDADERLQAETINEIKQITKIGKHSAYFFPRQNIMLGKWLKHGGWWPDYVPRLFKKSSLISWHGEVHESPDVKGSVGYAKSPLKHLTARSISNMFNKTIKWAKIEAQLNFRAGSKSVNEIRVLKAIITEFMSRYFLKLGIFDGRVGLIQAIFQSMHKATVLTYLWEMQNKTEENLKNFKDE